MFGAGCTAYILGTTVPSTVSPLPGGQPAPELVSQGLDFGQLQPTGIPRTNIQYSIFNIHTRFALSFLLECQCCKEAIKAPSPEATQKKKMLAAPPLSEHLPSPPTLKASPLSPLASVPPGLAYH